MLSVYAYEDVKSFLHDEFQRRVAENSRYSLRSYARDLNITLSRISDVFSNGAGISLETAGRIANKLGMSEYEREFFELLVQSQHSRNTDARRMAGLKIRNHIAKRNFKYLKENYNSILSHWYYLPLIETLTINKKHNLEHLAESFEITLSELNAAIAHLQEKGFISRKSEGRWIKLLPYIQVESSTPAQIIRSYHLRLLQKATCAIENQPIEDRKFLTSVFGIRKENLQEARKELERLNQDFIKKYVSEESSDRVYCMSLQFFRIDR